ncbi:MAG: hypothetical protein ACP6IU_06685 [Candidatus Asgardarchaeia archaeon]
MSLKGVCGENCSTCTLFKNGICKGCIAQNEDPTSVLCPIYLCAVKKHEISSCDLCPERYCDLYNKVKHQKPTGLMLQ